MPDIPLTLWLGGVQAPVVYQGRSGCCVGEDQIVFKVPDNAPVGCAVPLVAQINFRVSNSTLIPVANGSRDCAAANGALPDLPAKVAASNSLIFGDVGLQKGITNDGTGHQDTAYFDFYKIDLLPGIGAFAAAFLDDPVPGTCTVSDDSNPGNEQYGISSFATLNGGAKITVEGPNGSVDVPYNNGNDSVISDTGTLLVPGEITVTSAGGTDVGPFNATTTIIPATLTSPVSTDNLIVTRATGMTVTWTGGDPNGNVRIDLTSGPDSNPALSATAHCSVPAGLGTFTIPPYVTGALPASGTAVFRFFSAQPAVTFSADGIDFGTLHISIFDTVFGGIRVM